MDITNFFTVETSELSKSDRKIMKRMTSDLTNVESLTINHLAEEAGTSLASVQRFCQKMGYSGFKEFKFQLLIYIKKQESQEAAVSSSEYLDDYHDAINRVWTANEKDAEELAEVLATSSTNFIFGIYYSELPARLLSMGMRDLGKSTYFGDNLAAGEHLFPLSDENSTAVFYSVSGISKLFGSSPLPKSISHFKHSYLVTMNPDTPLKKYFKKVIVLPGKNLAQGLPVDPQSIPVVFTERVIDIAATKYRR
ncbi:MurR/RpiR family transcriptional regulator [Lactobacillus delbrueckii subsp. lactis]|uniref:MurR/RpiR family transcriptional regulator n=1 Tax=Lactobacillus delbrueckii TaxID=1584 RepID=UPI001E31DA8D|nr:MurR/RpiR family transcriptional regulator [Lactobacillus delbrueckii]MCD5598986.1 MurR/RpiR family transcriptional regulator [Lactobacillus delbrueckii subsp. lactis]